jgi:uncharacterized coiled-coil protein SlyX
MSHFTDESFRRVDDRVTSLVELLTHFERTVSELDGVVRKLHDRVDTLERRVDAISSRLRGLTEVGGSEEAEVAPDRTVRGDNCVGARPLRSGVRDEPRQVDRYQNPLSRPVRST